ncbi:MAG: ATP-binding protein [Hyphomicrobiales bacterium]|nr:ATP-binding protein [Hyphomicrobiales bacterium]
MVLSKRIHITRRFQRSIRIDSDLGDPTALDGFICPRTSAEVLATMARQVDESGHGAFTWTGPYGTGKSSLVVAFGALLNGNPELRNKAAKIFGREFATSIWKRLPTGTKGWRVLPVIGRRDDPVKIIGEAINRSNLLKDKHQGSWSESRLITALSEIAERSPNTYGGVILFIDEMGKFLEGAAQDGTDIYIFQQLAEASSRSKGRLIVIGVLHQAFEEYAHRLSHQVRDEWAKIQGRFLDLAVNTSGEEQIDLISRAIESDHAPKKPSLLAKSIARLSLPERGDIAEKLSHTLERCWPLHPVVACLLGPISRRRFGQNQRSIFGFLNSSEPHGFQDFLKRDNDRVLYRPEQLWDYLRANLEPSILASPDGHRWALAAEALERCEGLGGDQIHLGLLKTIALVDLFKERSGLRASVELLRTCFPDGSDSVFKKALNQLTSWSFVIFKKFQNSYSVYAGSDFDIDQAVRESVAHDDQFDFAAFKSLASLQPILAKRHYHETGALRWFDVNLVPVNELIHAASNYKPRNGSIGQFVLAIPTEGESEKQASELCRLATNQSEAWDTIVGLSLRSWAIVDLARELIALEKVRFDRPELAGDDVARREVEARLATLQTQLEAELRKSFDAATWFRKRHQPKQCQQAELSILASELAGRRFDQSPCVHNELLNRQKSSTSAVAAQNTLLRRMVLNETEARLGIDGYPAEGGLYASLLEASGLHRKTKKGWCFIEPSLSADIHRLVPLWEAATTYVRQHSNRSVAISEIYDLWRAAPFGVKDGLMPVLSVAFVLSRKENVAIYREGIFRARFDDVDVEYLAKDPTFIQLRWMNLSEVSRNLLSGMAEIIRRLDKTNSLVHLEPIDVARGLVAIHEQLPAWTKRTMRLSANALRVRNLFKRARDPNKFLFDDIPETLGQEIDLTREKDRSSVVNAVREGLEELVQAYQSMLHRLREIMLAELQVPNLSPQSLSELRSRATNIRELAGDFRLEAFVGRLANFQGIDIDVEGLASLAVDKPPRDWADPDVDRAAMEISDLAQRFLRAETFARIKGRPQKRQAMAVVIGMEGRPVPILEEFTVADADRGAIDDVIGHVTIALENSDTNSRSIILAALVELSARYMLLAQAAPSKELKVKSHG